MYEIINVALITDNSGEPPVLTYSNPVTTVVRQTPTPLPPIIRTVFGCGCGCCCGCCNSCCGCNGNF